MRYTILFSLFFFVGTSLQAKRPIYIRILEHTGPSGCHTIENLCISNQAAPYKSTYKIKCSGIGNTKCDLLCDSSNMDTALIHMINNAYFTMMHTKKDGTLSSVQYVCKWMFSTPTNNKLFFINLNGGTIQRLRFLINQ